MKREFRCRENPETSGDLALSPGAGGPIHPNIRRDSSVAVLFTFPNAYPEAADGSGQNIVNSSACRVRAPL